MIAAVVHHGSAERFDEIERDGFTVTLYTVPDEDSRPGEDDVTPAVEAIDWGTYYAEQQTRDDDGRFVRRGVVDTDIYGQPCRVSADELDRLEQIGWGGASYSRRRVRAILRDEAAAWIRGDRHYVGLVARVERGGLSAEASLWSIDCDDRERAETERYLRETGDELAREAIDELATQLLDGYAPLALSY